MKAKERLAGFRACVEDLRNSSSYFEEVNGDRRLWSDLSPQGKLGYISRDAALYDVPFKNFAEAVRESIGDAALLEAALRTVLRDAQEFLNLDRLFPPDGRTESTPLTERFKEILSQPCDAGHSLTHGKDRGIDR